MQPDIAPPPTPGPPYPPPRPRRLTRSSRERMWAGVAGGLAEYFELDPALVRLMWVAATIVTGGLAVPLYLLAWIILPRDDRPPVRGPQQWRDWSEEFHAETQRLAEEARRMAGEVREASQTWHEPQPTDQAAPPPPRDAATEKGAPTPTAYTPPPYTQTPPYTAPQHEPWVSPSDLEHQRRHHGPPRSAGVVLVGLGVLLLAANAGIFAFINWSTMWPLILIGLGVILLAKQTNWGG
jgi:phage shock protein C